MSFLRIKCSVDEFSQGRVFIEPEKYKNFVKRLTGRSFIKLMVSKVKETSSGYPHSLSQYEEQN